MLTQLREEESETKSEVANLERKLQKVKTAIGTSILQSKKISNKQERQIARADVYLKYKTNELRALNLTEKQIARQIKRFKKKKFGQTETTKTLATAPDVVTEKLT